MSEALPDLQNQEDLRGVNIDWVGVYGYPIPIKVKTQVGSVQEAPAKINVETFLSKEYKGTNMSRYTRMLEKIFAEHTFDFSLLAKMLNETAELVNSPKSKITISFPYFIKKESPASKISCHFLVPCKFIGEHDRSEEENHINNLSLQVAVDYMSLCPCSKEMSLYDKVNGLGKGAHNQRSVAEVTVKFRDPSKIIWIEDLVKLVEKNSSCPIYNILKREDEQFVTEAMYENPKFVEDVVRDLSLDLDKEKELISAYSIDSKHLESIHQFDAGAKISRKL